MSLKAIIYRAHFLQIISSQQYRAANVRLSKTGQSKNERYDDQVKTEIPELLSSSIELLNEALGISFSKLADQLHITPETLSVITGITIPESDEANNIEPLFRR